MFLLYPQLPRKLALELAEVRAGMPVSELAGLAASSHDKCIYSATGGSRVQRYQLDKLATDVRVLLEQHTERPKFDAALARLLHGQMSLSRAEGSSEGVWSFFGCLLLPDVVRWRFNSSAPTPVERFMGSSRGIRNVLGRCWWRGELLRDHDPPAGRDAHWLLDELVEDELTGLLERQKAVASRRTALALAKALVAVDTKGLRRMDVARDAFKRYLRLGYFVAFDALEEGELKVACEFLYYKSVRSLQKDAADAQGPTEIRSMRREPRP